MQAVRSTEGPQANTAWLWRIVRSYGRSAGGAIMCGIIAGITTSAVPYLIGVIIDHIRQGVQLDEIARYALALVGLTAISAAAFYGQRMLSGYTAAAVNFAIGRTLFENLQTLDQGFYQRYPTGDLISRVNSDVDVVWRLLALGLTRFGSAVLTLLSAIILLGRIHLPLTLLVMIILGISTAIQMRVGKFLAPVFEKVQEQAGSMAALAQDAISGVQTVKTFGRETVFDNLYRQRNVEYRRRWLYFARRNEPVGMVPNMISELTAALVVLFGGILTLNGTLTLGNFVQFLIYLNLIGTALLQLGTIYQRYQQTRGALARLTPLLQPAQIHDKPDAQTLPHPRGEITFDHVGVQIEGQWLLRDISLTIPAGTVMAFVGPTGSGKTLLVSLLARVIDPSEGRVLIDGIDARDLRLADLRRAIAYVPQSTFLFSMPLHRNVHMDRPNVAEDELTRAVHTSRLSNDLPQLPQGMDTMVGERGVMLSGGQKQRVAIARAIVQDPAILVLDDALSSVDTQTAADILADLRHVLRTRTSLIIAHRMATVKDADRVVVLSEGRIVEEGARAALLAQGGLYAEMVERELRRDNT